MTQEIINFLLGITILLISTNVFVSFARKISLALKISPLIVGVTVVSIGTSLPEFTISTLAVLKGDVGLALGNIIGSNVANVFLVLPVGILIGKLRIGTTKTQRSALLMVASVVLFIAFRISEYPVLIAGGLLLLSGFLITIAEYFWGVQGRLNEDLIQFRKSKRYSLNPLIVFAQLFSVIGIIGGGILVVSSVEKLSLLTGLSTTILGLSVTAVATSLPELVTTVFSQEHDYEKITIGNLIGSNIYNLLLVGGVILFFTNGFILAMHDWVFLVFATLVFASIIFTYSGKVIPKLIGVILFSFFLIYLLTLGIR